MKAGAVLSVITLVRRAQERAGLSERERERPALIVFSHHGWREFRADPAVLPYVAGLHGRLEDQPFHGCKIEVDPYAKAPWRVLSAGAALIREDEKRERVRMNR